MIELFVLLAIDLALAFAIGWKCHKLWERRTGDDYADLQARLDALMLEYCPEDMTDVQRARWAASQRVALNGRGDT